MPSFVDRKGTNWDVSLTLAGVRRIEASDFSAITSEPVVLLDPSRELLGEMFNRGSLIAAMVWALVQPQVPQASLLGREEFRAGLEKKLGRAKAAELTPAEREALWQEALQDEFVERIDGKALVAMREAWQEALIDFFPQWATVLRKWSEQSKSAQQKLSAGLVKILETEAPREIERAVEGLLAEARANFGG